MTKPLKRHLFIIEFSKDHHYGLLLVWKIRQGLQKNVEPSRIVKYVNFFSEEELLPHFEEEEKYLLPLLPETDDLRKRVEAEHAHLRKLLSACANDKVAPLKDLANDLEAHIRFEERIFFPHLEKNIDLNNVELKEIIVKHKRNNLDAKWIDTFWE